jgi:hypothetical protein
MHPKCLISDEIVNFCRNTLKRYGIEDILVIDSLALDRFLFRFRSCSKNKDIIRRTIGITEGPISTIFATIINGPGDEGYHWSIAFIDPIHSVCHYYDSMEDMNMAKTQEVLDVMAKCHLLPKRIRVESSPMPRQPRMWECGYFVCLYFELAVRSGRFTPISRKDLYGHLQRFQDIVDQMNYQETNKMVDIYSPSFSFGI